MKKIFLLIFFAVGLSSFGQVDSLSDAQINLSGANRVEFADGDKEIQKLAKFDIENQTPFILLYGGNRQFVSTSDEVFEKKYKIYFYNYGCLAPSEAVEKIYNTITFKFLVSKYGKEWMNQIRSDIPGLKEFKRSQK
jgi:hypothetical protein